MPRKVIYEHGLVTDGWISFDPADTGVIEQVFKKDIREGEERLMLAVLQDAVDCFQMYVLPKTEREKRLFQEAEDWILEKNSEWFFSFENICETLQLHPDYIRQGLLCWKEAKRKVFSLHEDSTGQSKLVKPGASGSSIRVSKTA
jgi:hypothetical protein